MSENVELVRSIYADWERGDYSSAAWAHPDIEYVLPDGPEPGGGKGLANMAEMHRNWLSAWGDWHVAAEEFVTIDSERVLVPFCFTARGKRSGVEIAEGLGQGASLFEIRGGKVVRLVNYFERALADLGLPG